MPTAPITKAQGARCSTPFSTICGWNSTLAGCTGLPKPINTITSNAATSNSRQVPVIQALSLILRMPRA